VDPQELANLAHLRRARDLIDREYARPLDVPAMEKRPGSLPPSLGRMTIALQYCHITVNDPDESLGFYRDALGLKIHNDVSSGGVPLGHPR
jgi:hypothetical protein